MSITLQFSTVPVFVTHIPAAQYSLQPWYAENEHFETVQFDIVPEFVVAIPPISCSPASVLLFSTTHEVIVPELLSQIFPPNAERFVCLFLT